MVSRMVWIGIGIAVLLVIVFRKQIFALLPTTNPHGFGLTHEQKTSLIESDPLDKLTKATSYTDLENFVQKEFVFPIEKTIVGLTQQIEKVPVGLEEDIQHLVGQGSITVDELVKALTGAAAQQTTAKAYGSDTKEVIRIPTLPDGINLEKFPSDRINVGDRVSGAVLNTLFGVDLPPKQEFEVIRKQPIEVRPIVKMVAAITPTGNVVQVASDRVPANYRVIG